MSSNFVNICRTCNGSDESLTELSDTDVDFIEYNIKLYFCVPTIEIDNSKLPQKLCKNCIEELRIAYNFKQKCLSSMRTLSEILNKEATITCDVTETVIIKQECVQQENNTRQVNVAEADDCFEDILSENIENAIEETYDEDHSYFSKTSTQQQQIKQENTDKELRDSVYNPIFPTLTKTDVDLVADENISRKVISSLNAPRRKRPIEKPYFCTICDTSFEENEYETHKLLHDNIKIIACPLCYRKFKNPSEIIQFFRHYCPQHNQPAFLLTCTVCYRKFKSSQALANHKKIHDNNKSAFKCKICKIYFVSLRKLNWHYGNGVHTDKKTRKLKHL